MLKSMDSDSQSSPQASTLTEENSDNARSPQTVSPNRRESGYGTDFSPLSAGSQPRRFTFDSEVEENDFDLSQEIEALHLNEDVLPLRDDRNERKFALDDRDDTDKEIEELLTDSGAAGISRTVSEPIDISPKRPTAPLPMSGDSAYEEDQCFVDIEAETGNRADFAHHRNGVNDGHRSHALNRLSRYCPSSLRSIGTQTPPGLQSPNEPEFVDLHDLQRPEQGHLTRGHRFSGLRLSIGDTEDDSPSQSLPDVVPFHRNRSVSLPEVQPLRQLDERVVGRTLRRISDEFEFYHRERRRRQHTSSLPLSVDLWNALRRYLARDLRRGSDNHENKTDMYKKDNDIG